jgi:hypothetical protein
MSQQWVFSGTMGQLWEVKLRGVHQIVRGRPASLTPSWFLYLDPQLTAKAVIEEGRVTKLRVEIPDDMETRIQNLIQTHTDPENYLAAVRKEYPFIRPAKIAVLGTEPVVEKPIEPAASASVQ